MQFWVADDSSNATFLLTSVGSRVVWLAGLTDVPLKKDRSVSVDGGTTWLPLDVQPGEAFSQHTTT